MVSINTYIAKAYAMTKLDGEEEKELVECYYVHGDITAAQKLVLSNLRYVVFYAQKFKNYGFSEEDLIQEGSVGLLKAVKNFDISIGVRFMSYAMHWIKAEIHEFMMRNWKTGKVTTTKASKKLYFNLRKYMRDGYDVSLNESEVKRISSELNVPEHEVRFMEQAMKTTDVSFDVPVNDMDEFSVSPRDYIPSNDDVVYKLEHKETMENINHAIESLGDRHKDIIENRFKENPMTLQELADKYGVSNERIRQLEQNALKKIREKV